MLKIHKNLLNLDKYLLLNISKFSTIKSDDINANNKNTSAKKCKGNTIGVSELGQPTYWTHPHLFANSTNFSKQVTPGITKDEFEQRRYNYVNHLTSYQKYYFSSKLNVSDKKKLNAKLADWNNPKNDFDMSTIDHNFIAVIPGAMSSFMAPDVPHIFKQNSDFLYLTGFKEPDCVLVISRTDPDVTRGSLAYKCALFVKEKNPKKEIWDGPSTGPQNVLKLCGINNAYPLEDLRTYLDSLLKETSPNRRITVWRYPDIRQESGPNCYNPKIEEVLDKFLEENKSNKLIEMNEQEPINASVAASYFNSSRYFVQLSRVKKSDSEIKIMQDACNISAEAFINSMKISHPYINEHLIYSKFDYDCRIRGSEYLAYIPVIAGGPRATILHYIRNNQIINNESLLLMDAGCQYREYVSDITRTWPVSGRFKNAQKELYQACLNVQKHCVENCVPGMSIQQLYYIMMRKLGEELTNLGLIDRKEHDNAIKSTDSPTDPIPMAYMQRLSNFCAHDVGHYLGLDVHDCPEISKLIPLEPNTVITIEPGIYIRPDDESVPYKYRGIGIRIEDDVVITSSGHQVLSSKCPKEIDQIEKILNNKEPSVFT